MRAQTEVSLNGADVALFVIDARAGITPLDEEIGRWLREPNVPVVLVANKAEGKARATAGCSMPMRWALAIRCRCRPNMARAWATCSRHCCRMIEGARAEG